MDCDRCGKLVTDSENIFDTKFSEQEKIAVHKNCAKKTGGLDYFHGLRHTVWPAIREEYKTLKRILGRKFNKES